MLLHPIFVLVLLTSIPPSVLYLSALRLMSSPSSRPRQLSLLFPTFIFTSHLLTLAVSLLHPVALFGSQLRSGETAAIVARELAEQTKGLLRPGDVPSTVRAMAQLVELLDVQLRNLTPGGKDSAARSLTKVTRSGTLSVNVQWVIE